MSNELSPRGESRRTFVRGGALLFARVATLSEIPVAAAGIKAYDFFNPLVSIYNEREILNNYTATNNTKPYDKELLEGHRFGVFGDSNAYGNIVHDPEVSYPAPRYITERMQEKGYDWDVQNFAVIRSMSNSTLGRLKSPEARQFLKNTKGYDVYLGVGGNNPREILEDKEKRKEILWLKDHPKNGQLRHDAQWNWRAANMAHTVVGTMNDFESDLSSMMDYLKDLKRNGSANGLERVFVLGLPDISQLPKITIQDDEGHFMSIPIASNPVVSTFVRNIEIGMINRALNVTRRFNPAFNGDVHFLNPFTTVGPDDLREIHLNLEGQGKMAREQMRRSPLSTGGTLLDLVAA